MPFKSGRFGWALGYTICVIGRLDGAVQRGEVLLLGRYGGSDVSLVGVASCFRWGFLVDEASQGGAERKVVELTEGIEANVSGPVDEDQAGCAP